MPMIVLDLCGANFRAHRSINDFEKRLKHYGFYRLDSVFGITFCIPELSEKLENKIKLPSQMLILLLVPWALCRTVVMLINTSKDFFNYRHMSNIQVMRRLFLDSGIHEDNLLCVFREDPHTDSRNISKNKIYLRENEWIEHIPMTPTLIDEHAVLNLLYLRDRRLIDLDENDSIIVYLCGHGTEGFMKVSDRYFIFRDDLMNAVKFLSKRLCRVLLILDTCQAARLVNTECLGENVCVVTTSQENEFSYSSESIGHLGVFGVDDFPYALYKSGLGLKKTMISCFECLKLKSTVKCWGNGEILYSDFLVEDFPRKIKEFVL